MLRSAVFWFPLFIGFVCVQAIGARNLLAARPEDLETRLKRTKSRINKIEKEQQAGWRRKKAQETNVKKVFDDSNEKTVS